MGPADLALSHIWQLVFGWTEDRPKTIESMIELSKQAVASDPHDAYALVGASFGMTFKGRQADGSGFARKAVQANPNLALAHAALGFSLVFAGHYQQSIESVELAMRLSPRDPFMAIMLAVIGISYYLAEQYEAAEGTARQLILEHPGMPTGYRQLAATLAQLGRLDEAQAVVADHLLRLIPGHTATQAGQQLPFGGNEDGRHHVLEGLRKAGLPE